MSSTAKTPIFVIGATGYIGGTVLARLLSHPSADTFDITAIVRSEDKAKKLEKFGVKAVIGSYKDTKLVEELAEKAHVVFSLADADDLPAIQAVLRGLRKRHATLGDLPILIHTSGTGVLATPAKGNFVRDLIYDDLDADQIETIPKETLHRDVDLPITEADKEGYVRTYIVVPSTIYNLASNPLVEAGIQNPRSIQIPQLIQHSIDRGQAGVVGKGVALWPDVDIDDLGELYITLFDAIVKNPENVGHGREGFYFGENGEHPWYDISKEIAKVLHEKGLSKTDEPTSFTDEELIKYWGSLDSGNYSGSNSRCRANRSRSIGWKPKKTSQDMIASIRPEIEYYLKTRSQ